MSSVAGTIPDQTWGQALPGYFKDNVQPQIYESAYLIQRPNIAIPDVVSENTVGMGYDRGFIDKPVPRFATIRSYIENPSTYIKRLHPHDLTSGTGGIDNLSNLYRFGQPLPVANAGDFVDIEYWASRELQRQANDPLSNGYAKKVLGPMGIQLQAQMLADAELSRKRELYRQNKYTLEANKMAARERLDGDAPEEIDIKNQNERAQAASDAADNETAPVDENADDYEADALGKQVALNRDLATLRDEAITGYNTDTAIGQYEGMQHNLTYTAIMRNQFKALRGPVSSMFSNTPVPTSNVQFKSGFKSAVSGTSVGRDQASMNDQDTNPMLKRFRRESVSSNRYNSSAEVNASSNQISHLQQGILNNETKDGDVYDQRDLNLLGGHSESQLRPAQTVVNAPTRGGLSNTLAGNVGKLDITNESTAAATMAASRAISKRKFEKAIGPNFGITTVGEIVLKSRQQYEESLGRTRGYNESSRGPLTLSMLR